MDSRCFKRNFDNVPNFMCIEREWSNWIRTLNYIKTPTTKYLILIYCHILLDFVAANSKKLEKLENKSVAPWIFVYCGIKKFLILKMWKKRKKIWMYIYSFKIHSNHEQKRWKENFTFFYFLKIYLPTSGMGDKKHWPLKCSKCGSFVALTHHSKTKISYMNKL